MLSITSQRLLLEWRQQPRSWGTHRRDRPIGAGLPLRKLAVGWLRDYLRGGQRSQYNVETAAQRDGMCIRTLRRAKFDLGVVSTKESISGCWNWALPENEELANA